MLTTYEVYYDVHLILKVLISDYLESLTKLFPNSVKPKHLFLIHYPRILFFCGPLWKLSTMRFEAKHREGKITSHHFSRVDVCKTIAIKNQLRLNYRFFKKNVPRKISYDLKSIKNMQLLNIKGYFKLSQNSPASICILSNIISTIKRVQFEEKNIEIGKIIMSPNEDGPIFYIILFTSG